ncbi:MAG: LD-carboxypeptidase [Bacteroidota bacterium]
MPLPPPLTPSSRVAVAAPASGVLARSDAEAGLTALRKRGLTVDPGRCLAPRLGYLSGPDADRAAEMNALFARDDLDAIVCVRGGYGVLRLLDALDFDALARHPKLIVGYSDITALHLAAWRHAGVPGLSAAMVAPDWPTLDAESEQQLWEIAGGAHPWEITGPGGERLTPIREGEAEGLLLGGNLTLVAALFGTPYLPDLTGAILFIEDVGEVPYRIDGLLARLRLAGVLDRLGGLVFGAFTGATPPANRPSLTMDEVIGHYAEFVNGPVARGLVYGHFPRKTPMPVGVTARLRVSRGEAHLTTLSPLTLSPS